jgi:hypothetical protein
LKHLEALERNCAGGADAAEQGWGGTDGEPGNNSTIPLFLPESDIWVV